LKILILKLTRKRRTQMSKREKWRITVTKVNKKI
jgi:hypothetical protein